MQVHVACQKVLALTLVVYHFEGPFVADSVHGNLRQLTPELHSDMSSKHGSHRRPVPHEERLTAILQDSIWALNIKSALQQGELACDLDQEVIPSPKIKAWFDLWPDRASPILQLVPPATERRMQIDTDAYDNRLDLPIAPGL